MLLFKISSDKYSSDVQDAVDNKTNIMKEVHNSNINQKVFACFLEIFWGLCPGQGQQVKHGPGEDLSVNYWDCVPVN